MSHYVITEPCIGVCDTACVEVCPVDCIHGPLDPEELAKLDEPARRERSAGVQMYINPAECICCSACEPVCPVRAIFVRDEVPEPWEHFIELNARFFESRG